MKSNYNTLGTTYEDGADLKFCKNSYKTSGGTGNMSTAFYKNCKLCKDMEPNKYGRCMFLVQNTPVPLEKEQIKCGVYNPKYFSRIGGSISEIKTSTPLTKTQLNRCFKKNLSFLKSS